MAEKSDLGWLMDELDSRRKWVFAFSLAAGLFNLAIGFLIEIVNIGAEAPEHSAGLPLASGLVVLLGGWVYALTRVMRVRTERQQAQDPPASNPTSGGDAA